MKVNVKAVLSSPDYKVITLSGDQGDTLEKHKVSEPGLLLVKRGSVTYTEGERHVVVSEGEAHSIPAEVFHEVRCNEVAEVFVVMSRGSKMKFER